MTLPELRKRLILGLNMHDTTLKLERGWCTVNNWTLFMHALTRDGNDESINVYGKQKAHAIIVGLVWTEVNIDHTAN